MGMLRERLRYTWIAHFAKPANLRPLHRAVRRQRVRRILELGIGDAARAKALIRTAAIDGGPAEVTYAAIDLFEARPALSLVDDPRSGDPSSDAHQPLPLKEAYRRLKSTGAQIRLLPGDPYSALARGANDLGQLDMIIMGPDVLGADVNAESLSAAWFYVPRLLHEETQFWTARRDDEGEVRYELAALADIRALAHEATARRRAASAAATTARRGSMRRAA